MEEHAFEDFAVSLQEVRLYGKGGGPDMVGKPAVELPSVFPRCDGQVPLGVAYLRWVLTRRL